YSPSSYFLYRDEPMGYDYSLVKQFAEDRGMALKLTVAPSLHSMVEMLDSGLVDVAAYEIPVTAEYRSKVVPCGPETLTHQVLVQPLKDGKPEITDVTQLVGREVFVEDHSKYLHRLENLDNELGGGVLIRPVDRDTLITEDLIEMVAKGEIPLTVVDSDIARVNRKYYPRLDTSLALSFPQRARWGVAPGMSWLGDSIDAYFAEETPHKRQAELLKRYFEMSKEVPESSLRLDLSKGRISPYDDLFRKYAGEIGWDWRILAAQAYKESNFDTTRVSWAGARGLMQIMPSTARAYGLPASKMTNPEASIAAAARIMADLDRMLAKKVTDPEERRKFVIGAYNSGIGHVYDAIALAQKYGKNPQVWDGNVESALLMKAKPEYYQDPVCRSGYFRGRETVAYVREVTALYEKARKSVKL
ncbi:MAG: transglycosylase SLT domain-containing protein, partial [Muribaculaceae bacterium]|nr:transglycosylase SLT domain-containing protein [Muribaculaceae bacterium]